VIQLVGALIHFSSKHSDIHFQMSELWVAALVHFSSKHSDIYFQMSELELI